MRISWPDTCPAFKKDLFHTSTIINRPDFYYAQHLAIQNLYDIPANPNSITKSVIPTSISYSDAFLTKKVNPEPENVGIPEPTIEETDETYPRSVIQNFKVLKTAAEKLVTHNAVIANDSENQWAGISVKSITGDDDEAYSTVIPAALSNFGPPATKSFIMQSLTLLPKELNGCSKIPEPVSQNLKSKFVIVPRGNCTFVEKVYHLQLSGAVGVIFHSNQNKYHFPAVGHLKKVNQIITIPSALITNSSAIRIYNMIDRHPYLAVGFEKASSDDLFQSNDYLI
ncbi:hypothetical protein CONCODRAFT_109322 [Conidiobolus coronatus NRRL 28638]|uniref:PA domain-containing protein n=1 Tax=Conidiobolus coronatus (strain ATCC 28846 / CBS 209.66 / NRRL 28638) TaxID=796925 RepID=A0A137NZ77_CONC2|nr:hypothetical protein CONCODRAFT_109322 [Conidiobolus coronatus NRRL 28638]|eukprot:KXN68008.1 hypothetical protein CONCODRAFT_109322 [Conidiobolus coronatus NRRL 28638]